MALARDVALTQGAPSPRLSSLKRSSARGKAKGFGSSGYLRGAKYGEGAGSAPRGAKTPEEPPKPRAGAVPTLDEAEAQRAQQAAATRLIASFLEAEDDQSRRLAVEGAAHAGRLDEGLMRMLDMYCRMAEKDGEPEIVAKLRALMEVVFEETQKTLRPEIALLNTLMRKSSDAAARGEALAQAAAAGTLDRDGGYFFSLLERVRRDVGAQRGNPQREETLELLAGVRDQAEKARRGGRTQPTTP